MKKRTVLGIGVALVVILLLFVSGVGRRGATPNAVNTKGKVVKFLVVSQYKPFGYFNENGKLDGYEPAVLKALDKVIPNYKFEFITGGEDAFSELQSGKVDALASQWSSNAERRKKYTLTDVAYSNFGNYIVWDKDKHHNFQSLEDLRGKNVFGYTGSAPIATAEIFNKEKGGDNPIKIKYSTSSDTAKTIKDFQSGVIDAQIATDYDVKQWNKAFGSDLVTSKRPVFSSGSYYVLKKGNTDLKNALDKGVTKLKEDGTLTKLSKKYLGDDYTKAPNK